MSTSPFFFPFPLWLVLVINIFWRTSPRMNEYRNHHFGNVKKKNTKMMLTLFISFLFLYPLSPHQFAGLKTAPGERDRELKEECSCWEGLLTSWCLEVATVVAATNSQSFLLSLSLLSSLFPNPYPRDY